MKISFFIGSLRRAGAERVLSVLANHFAELGNQVEIVVLMTDEVGYELNSSIKVVQIIGKSKKRIKNLPYWLKNIREYVKKSKPDRIVAFAGRINVLVLTACMGLDIPIVVSERNDPKQDGRSARMLKICEYLYYTKAAAVVFQTNYEQSCFSNKLSSKSHIIPNPVRVMETCSHKNNNRIVTAGRLWPQKNHKMLIEAADLLLKSGIEFSMEIYGEGTLMDELLRDINVRGLSEYVFLKGNVSDLHYQIKDASIFVMTSLFEGLSNALIEAQMMGFACITSDYPGAEEIIIDNYNGIIVEQNNAQALADVISELIRNSDLREKLSHNALVFSQKYTYSNVFELWDNVILGVKNESNT